MVMTFQLMMPKSWKSADVSKETDYCICALTLILS